MTALPHRISVSRPPLRLADSSQTYRAPSLAVARSNAWDKAVMQLSRRGFTANVVAAHTGLSVSQVAYRRGALSCGPRTWSRGLNDEARSLLGRIDRLLGAKRELIKHLDGLKKRR